MGTLFFLVAVVLFVLAAFGVTLGDLDTHDISNLGLACFASGHLVGGTWQSLRSRF